MLKKITLTFFRVEGLGKFLPALWRNGNKHHQNYKSPEKFWSYVRIEVFPFSGKILMFAMKEGEFSRLVFQVIGIFYRKKTPFDEFCLMGGLIFFMQYGTCRRDKVLFFCLNTSELNTSTVLANPGKVTFPEGKLIQHVQVWLWLEHAELILTWIWWGFLF